MISHRGLGTGVDNTKGGIIRPFVKYKIMHTLDPVDTHFSHAEFLILYNISDARNLKHKTAAMDHKTIMGTLQDMP